MTAFDTPEPISVDLRLGCGDVRIVASDRSDTIVDVRPSDPANKDDIALAEQTRVDYVAGRLLVQATGWKQWLPWKGRESIDVQIELPAGSDVRGEAAIAPLHCEGRLGECRYTTSLGDIEVDQAGPVQLKTGGGDMTVEWATDRAEVATGSGAARLARIDGTAVIKNSNGDTSVGYVAGDVQVKAADGRISVEHADASVTVKTANGDVRLGEVSHGAILAESGHGRIEVGVRDGVAAWLDLNTGYGNVQSDLEAARGPEPGEDTVEVRAHTSFGDITVSRRLANSVGKDMP